MIKVWLLTIILSTPEGGITTVKYNYLTESECISNGPKVTLSLVKTQPIVDNSFLTDKIKTAKFICINAYN